MAPGTDRSSPRPSRVPAARGRRARGTRRHRAAASRRPGASRLGVERVGFRFERSAARIHPADGEKTTVAEDRGHAEKQTSAVAEPMIKRRIPRSLRPRYEMINPTCSAAAARRRRRAPDRDDAFRRKRHSPPVSPGAAAPDRARPSLMPPTRSCSKLSEILTGTMSAGVRHALVDVDHAVDLGRLGLHPRDQQMLRLRRRAVDHHRHRLATSFFRRAFRSSLLLHHDALALFLHLERHVVGELRRRRSLFLRVGETPRWSNFVSFRNEAAPRTLSRSRPGIRRSRRCGAPRRDRLANSAITSRIRRPSTERCIRRNTSSCACWIGMST